MSRTTKTNRARVAYKAAKTYLAQWNQNRVHAPDALYPLLDLRMSGRRSGNNRLWHRDLKLEKRKLDRLRGNDDLRERVEDDLLDWVQDSVSEPEGDSGGDADGREESVGFQAYN